MRQTAYILVLASFLVGVIAPACGFNWGGTYSVIEICTSQGIESLIVDHSDKNNPDHHADEQCPFCIQNAHIKYFMVPENQTLRAFQIQEKLKFETYEVVFLSRLKEPQSLRGPPILS